MARLRLGRSNRILSITLFISMTAAVCEARISGTDTIDWLCAKWMRTTRVSKALSCSAKSRSRAISTMSRVFSTTCRCCSKSARARITTIWPAAMYSSSALMLSMVPSTMRSSLLCMDLSDVSCPCALRSMALRCSVILRCFSCRARNAENQGPIIGNLPNICARLSWPSASALTLGSCKSLMVVASAMVISPARPASLVRMPSSNWSRCWLNWRCASEPNDIRLLVSVKDTLETIWLTRATCSPLSLLRSIFCSARSPMLRAGIGSKTAAGSSAVFSAEVGSAITSVPTPFGVPIFISTFCYSNKTMRRAITSSMTSIATRLTCCALQACKSSD